MTILDLLKEYYDMEMNNVFSYSADYRMNSPKKGYEQEWNEAVEKSGLPEEMIKDMQRQAG